MQAVPQELENLLSARKLGVEKLPWWAYEQVLNPCPVLALGPLTLNAASVPLLGLSS